MTEIRLRFDLAFSRRFVAMAGAAAIMLCAVPELDSESVTLSTYYPAPSGVYTNMITTSNSYLARDGGRYINGAVGSALALGTVTPEVNSKLTVSGGGISGSYGITPRYTNWAAYGTGDGGAAIYNSNQGAYQALMLVGNNSGGGVRRVKVWDELTVNGNSYASGTLSATSAVTARQTGCTDSPTWTIGPNQVVCPGGYVTIADGFYANRYTLSSTTDPNGRARCCPCPSGGCVF